jgi:DoxX-like family
MTTNIKPTTDGIATRSARRSRRGIAGMAITALVAAFLAIDSFTRIGGARFSREEIESLGFSPDKTAVIGWALLVCLVVFLIPRTATLGALGLTAYLGGAVTASLRADLPLATVVLSAVYAGVLMWIGLILRRPELLRVLGLRRD